jgi:hypothetical protein
VRGPDGPTDSSFVLDLARSARRTRSGDFIRWHCSSKFGRGPFQRRSSMVSKTGTSSRRVARVRNNKASFHELRSDSDSGRALRIDGCHSCQSFGMSSSWAYRDNYKTMTMTVHVGPKAYNHVAVESGAIIHGVWHRLRVVGQFASIRCQAGISKTSPGSSKHGIHQVEIMQAAIDIPLGRNALGNRSRLPGEQHRGICAVTVVKTFDACGR